MTEAVATRKPTLKASQEPQKALYAVFATGGKQYRVKAGDSLKIEVIHPSTGSGQASYKEGAKLTFDSVLMTDNGASEVTLGNPFLAGSAVSATLTKIGRAAKVTVIKYKQKSRYFKKNGHRQPYFEIKIDSVK